MGVYATQFTTDAHAGNKAKIYGFYNNSCNVRHHAGKPAGETMITRMVKVHKNIYKQVFCLPPFILVNVLHAE